MGLPKIFTRLGNACLGLTVVSFGALLASAYFYGTNRFESFQEIMRAPFFQKGLWVILSAAGLLGAGLFYFLGAAAGKRLYNELVKNGREAEARVLAINDTGTRINNDPLVTVAIEVVPDDLPAFRTEVNETVSVLFLPYLQPGKRVRVKYLPGTETVAIVGSKAPGDQL